MTMLRLHPRTLLELPKQEATRPVSKPATVEAVALA